MIFVRIFPAKITTVFYSEETAQDGPICRITVAASWRQSQSRAISAGICCCRLLQMSSPCQPGWQFHIHSTPRTVTEVNYAANYVFYLLYFVARAVASVAGHYVTVFPCSSASWHYFLILLCLKSIVFCIANAKQLHCMSIISQALCMSRFSQIFPFPSF